MITHSNPLATLLFVLLASLMLAAPVRGETAPPRPGWHPHEVYGDDRVPPGDVRVIESRLAAVEELVTNTTGYAAPQGFEIMPRWSYTAGDRPDQLTTYRLSLHRYEQTREVAAGGYTDSLTIVINPRLRDITDVGSMESEDGQIYFSEPPRSAPINGATVVWGKYGENNTLGFAALYSAGHELPMSPVSREQYLRALIFGVEGKDQEKLKAEQEFAEKTPYQRWMDDAEERRKSNEQIAAMIETGNKAEAEKYRAEVEQAERETTESLKQSEAEDREKLDNMLASSLGNQLRDQIAAMSPEERASQAWTGAVDLVPEGTPLAQAEVMEDPAFYTFRKSPVEVRAILVFIPTETRSAADAQGRLYREFDWAALKRLIDQ